MVQVEFGKKRRTFVGHLLCSEHHCIFHFSDRAAIGVEINSQSRHWLEYECESTLKPKHNMSSILLSCTLLKDKYPINIPEESTVQCVRTVKDPKERLVKLFN